MIPPSYLALFVKHQLIMALIFVLCVSISLLTRTMSIRDETTSIMNYINQNLAKPPIKDLRFTSGECPQGFEQESLGVWPGIIDPYYKHSQTDINVWKGKKVCISRLKDYFYHKQCQKGYKICGPGLCANSQEKCPITNLTKVESPNFSEQDEVIEYMQGIYFKIERKIDSLPLVIIQYSTGKHPCYAKDWSPNYPSFLDNPNKMEGCTLYGQDKDAYILDSTYIDYLFQENGLENKYKQDPDYNSDIVLEPVILAVRRRIEVHQSCITDHQFKEYSFIHSSAKFEAIFLIFIFFAYKLRKSILFEERLEAKEDLTLFKNLIIAQTATVLLHNLKVLYLMLKYAVIDFQFEKECFVTPALTNAVGDFNSKLTFFKIAPYAFLPLLIIILIYQVKWVLEYYKLIKLQVESVVLRKIYRSREPAITAAILSVDERLLILGDSTRCITIWEISRGKKLYGRGFALSHKIGSLSCTLNGKYLLVSSTDGDWTIVDLYTLKAVRSYSNYHHNSQIEYLGGKDRQLIVTPNTVKVYNFLTRQELYSEERIAPETTDFVINSSQFSRDGNFVFLSGDWKIDVVDVKRKRQTTLSNHDNYYIKEIRLSSDQEILIALTVIPNVRFYIWDWKGQSLLNIISVRRGFYTLTNRYLYLGQAERQIILHLWNLKSMECEGHINLYSGTNPSDVLVTQDNSTGIAFSSFDHQDIIIFSLNLKRSIRFSQRRNKIHDLGYDVLLNE